MNLSNPYHPPMSDPVPLVQARTCPECGCPMEAGDANGSLYWTTKVSSGFRRMLSRGKPLIGGSFRLTVYTPHVHGHHCTNCGLTILKIPQ